MDIVKEKQEIRSLTKLIFEKIREDILNNEYRPGEKMIASKIAEDLCVSRTSVREALKQLTMAGLVDEIPNKCIVVKGVSKQDVIDIYNFRLAIEPIAISWAVERIDKADLKKLDEICNLMEFYCLKDNTDKVLNLSKKFHETIYSSIGNRFFERVLKDFHLLVKMPRILMIKKEGRIDEILREHRQILEALVERDTEKAILHSMNHTKILGQII